MAQRLDIGIDGGGSGCRVALSVDGASPVEVTGPPANIVTDAAAAEAAIRVTLDQALAQVGMGRAALREARICAGLAGGRLPDAADAFATRLPFLAYVVDDSVTALEGAFDGADGTLISLGTGSFFIRRVGADIRHLGGWGFHLGDEASAAWVGRRALSLCLWVEDGRRAPDPLADALRAATPPHPVEFARQAGPADMADLAFLVLEHADTALGRHLIAEVQSVLTAGLADLGHNTGDTLALCGGFGTALAPHLPDRFSKMLVAPTGRPLDGALRMARALP